MTDPDLPALEAAILAVDGVAALHGGDHGTVASYLPGRRLTGLRIDADEAAAHLAVYEGHDLATVAETVRAVVARAIGRDSRSVVITIEDLVPLASAGPHHTTDQEIS